MDIYQEKYLKYKKKYLNLWNAYYNQKKIEKFKYRQCK